MKERNFIAHPLEYCVYLSTRKATGDDDPFECFQLNNENRVVDGALELRVDDLNEGSAGVSSERDTINEKRCNDMPDSF